VPVTRYRIARPIPPRIDYPSAAYALEIVKQQNETIPVDEWALQARKIGVGTVCVIASALAFRSRWLETLDRGFDVENSAPAARIMARLVRDGIAVEMRRQRG
jgi:hypothetical protein